MAGVLFDQFGGVVSRISHEDGVTRITNTQELDDTLDAIKRVPDVTKVKGKNRHWLGTVPILIAQQWATECGAAIGTKEWGVYAKRKLADGTWRKLTAAA